MNGVRPPTDTHGDRSTHEASDEPRDAEIGTLVPDGTECQWRGAVPFVTT